MRLGGRNMVWQLLVLGSGNYSDEVGALPGAIADAKAFAAKIGGSELCDSPPAALLDLTAAAHYQHIDAWIEAPDEQKMLYCAGHGCRCGGIFCS